MINRKIKKIGNTKLFNNYPYVILALVLVILGTVFVNSLWISSEHLTYHDASDVKITIDGNDLSLQEAFSDVSLVAFNNCSIPGTCSQICIGNDCVTDWTPYTCSCIDADGDGHYPLSCTDLDCSLPIDDCDDTNGNIYYGSSFYYFGPDLKDVNCDGDVSMEWVTSDEYGLPTYFHSVFTPVVSSDTCDYRESLDQYNPSLCLGIYAPAYIPPFPTDRCDLSMSEFQSSKCGWDSGNCFEDYYSPYIYVGACR